MSYLESLFLLRGDRLGRGGQVSKRHIEHAESAYALAKIIAQRMLPVALRHMDTDMMIGRLSSRSYDVEFKKVADSVQYRVTVQVELVVDGELASATESAESGAMEEAESE